MLAAYSVAVKLSLVNNVSAGLAAMATQFVATNKQAEALQKKLAAIKTQGLWGATTFSTGAAMAAPLVYAVSKAAELQKQLIGVQIATKGSVAEMANMRRGIEGIASQTIFSNIDVAKMAKMVATGTGLGAGDVSKLLPIYAKFADVQMLMKGTSYESSTKDAIRLAHTAQHYTPAALGKYMDLLTKASFIVPGGLSEVGHALKYSQGIGKTALGIGDNDMVLLTAMLNRMGFAGSRGGTNLIAAMSRSIPGIFGSGLLTGKSGQALTAMGMADSSGHSKFMKNGSFDSFAWIGGLSEYVQREFARNPAGQARQNIMTNMQHAFGTQGARVTSLLADPNALSILRTLGGQFAQYGGVDSIQQKFADESTKQQMINAKTNFTSLLTEVGYTLLPAASAGLNVLNRNLQRLIKWTTDNPGKVEFMAKSFGMLAASLMFGGAVNLMAAGFKGLRLALSIFSVGSKAGLLTNVATGFTGISGALIGNAGLVAACGAAGFGIGKLVNKMLGIENGEFGGWLYDVTHRSNGQSAFSDDWRNHMGQSNKPIVAHTQVNLDGRKIASVVSRHQSSAAAQPQSGVSFFDSLMGVPSPANPY